MFVQLHGISIVYIYLEESPLLIVVLDIILSMFLQLNNPLNDNKWLTENEKYKVKSKLLL